MSVPGLTNMPRNTKQISVPVTYTTAWDWSDPIF